jgi:hypothetical protein
MLRHTPVLLLVVLTGCLVSPPIEVPDPPAAVDSRLSLHGALNATSELARLAQQVPVVFDWFDLGVSGAEPSLGITSQGHAFYVAYEAVLRSRDGGKTWQRVTGAVESPLTLDPMLWVDPDTDRVVVNQLYVGCSWMSWSDDDGATWTTNPAACGTPVNDHQKIVAAKPRLPAPTVGYPKVFYYCYNGLEYSGCATSRTGGLTWEPARVAFGPGDCDEAYSYVHGRIRAAPDGTVYLPKIACGPQVAVSRDDGLTWRQTRIDAHLGHAAGLVNSPDIGVDAEGTVYFVWSPADGLLYLSISRDQGATWSAPVRVTPPHVTSALRPSVVAGDAGRIAVAYWATTADTTGWNGCNGSGPTRWCGEGPYADYAPAATHWHQWVTFSLDADTVEPGFLTVQVTADDDPLQVGSIHMGGGGDADRNLLDFIDAALGPDGRVWVATADGCLPAEGCRLDEPGTSRHERAAGAVLRTGPSLRVDALMATP